MTIGGTTAVARNLISGFAAAVVIQDAGTAGNLVEGNFIGTDVSGARSLRGSGTFGIEVFNGAAVNTIGGTAPGAGNVVGGDYSVGLAGSGVIIDGASTTSNLVEGNFIGVDVSGTNPVGYLKNAVSLSNNTAGNTIGGNVAGARNIMTGGIVVAGTIGVGANVVQGNDVGVDASGARLLGNGANTIGIQISGSSGNTIGGAAPGAGNVVAGSGLTVGIEVTSGVGFPKANIIQGNDVGVNSGRAAVLGSEQAGIQIDSAAMGNVVGGSNPGDGNVVGGATSVGLRLSGAGVKGNIVQGNLIGVASAAPGAVALPNAGDGIQVENGAANNTIGGISSGGGTSSRTTAASAFGSSARRRSATRSGGTSSRGTARSGSTSSAAPRTRSASPPTA